MQIQIHLQTIGQFGIVQNKPSYQITNKINKQIKLTNMTNKHIKLRKRYIFGWVDVC